jgi:hypothetical protein
MTSHVGHSISCELLVDPLHRAKNWVSTSVFHAKGKVDEMRSLACSAALIGATLAIVPSVGTAHAAPGDWAAIAYDPDGKTGWPNNGFWVTANHIQGQMQAVNAVMSQCVSGPGMGGSSAPCDLVALVQDGCVALLALDGVANPAAGTGPTIEAAIASTAAGKRVTEVEYAECTY